LEAETLAKVWGEPRKKQQTRLLEGKEEGFRQGPMTSKGLLDLKVPKEKSQTDKIKEKRKTRQRVG